MNQELTDFIISFGIGLTTFIIGVFLGIFVMIGDVKKKGTLKMKSGVLRYIPNSVLGSDLGGVA